MDYIQNQPITNKLRRLKIFLWIIILFFLFLPYFLRLYLNYYNTASSFSLIMISALLTWIGYITLLIIYFLSRKFYNWPLVLFLVLLLSMFLRRYNVPVGVGALCNVLAIVSIGNSVKILRNSHTNLFIGWFGFSINIIVSLFMLGFSWYGLRIFGGYSNICIYMGSLLFLISILGMVFTLPQSNYNQWNRNDRKIFIRGIIFPMLFVFVLICLIFVFNDTFRMLLNNSTLPWDVGEVRLLELEGIP